MPISVVMPALEMAQETGKLVSWLKQEGEQVAKGDMLIEIETDKAVVEVEAAGDGVLAGITARVGDVVPVGQTIAWLLKPGESVPAPEDVAHVQTGRRTDTAPAAASAASAPAPVADAGKGIRVSPKARRLAGELGVDLASLKGSGPGGEILTEDVQSAAAGAKAAPAAAGATEALSTVGRLMAERTTSSWTTVPHFFVSRDVDATALNAARAKALPDVERSHQVKVTHTDILVAAVGRTLRAHSRLNASWAKGGVAVNADVHVALAMAVEDAVVTAVIRNADRASLGEIATARRDLTERARAGRLSPADISGATFTISNLGMFGVDAFTAIIVQPQAAILAVGAIADRVVAVNGSPAVRPYMTMTLSSDHRVVDGARAASFLRDLVTAIQEPGAWLS
ncbi:MAG: dihydrolipoamide acetyltransferase family protein [Vicinamibacterales bacterium]